MAKYSGFAWDETFTADADLSAKQWYFVTTASTAGNVKVATGGSGPAALGVLQNDPKAGEEAQVRLLGSSKVVAIVGTAIGFGEYLVSSSVGQAERTATAGSNPINALALEALSSGSAYIEALLLLPGGAVLADNVP